MTVRLGLAGLALAAGSLAAQTPTRAAGVVLRPQDADTAAVAGVRVVLHEVGRATQGPIDSVLTDRHGRFGFRFRADSTANYLVSARYAGIMYFSVPLATNPALPDTGVTLLVFDTASTAPVETRTRTLVVGAPDAIGARTVVDWIVLENRGVVTRVGADTLTPTWTAPLPEGVRNQQVSGGALSQISSDAVEFRGDSMLVFAPLSPGEKELLVQYELPPAFRRLELALSGLDSADVFVEERSARLGGGDWIRQEPQLFEGRSFQRFASAGAPTALVLQFRRAGLGPGALPLVVAGTALGLAVLSWLLLRRRRPAAAAAPSSVTLADRIARLDREAERTDLSADARAELERERRALAEQLRLALAARSRRS